MSEADLIPESPGSPPSAGGPPHCLACHGVLPPQADQCPACGSERHWHWPVAPPDRALIEQFRAQMKALGVIWVLYSLVSAVATGFILFGDLGSTTLPRFIAVSAATSMVLGTAFLGPAVGVFLYQKWALSAGYFLCLACGAVSLAGVNACWLLPLCAALPQVDRLRQWAHQIEAAGLPLDIRPDELRERLASADYVDPPSATA